MLITVGHREDLLQGAKACLYAKGYLRTTARDIVAASRTNLGSIGYHFGSKEVLLNLALIEALGEWGAELAAVLGTQPDADAGPLERFQLTWNRVVGLFGRHGGLLAANFEVFAHAQNNAEVREMLKAGLREGREGLGRMFYRGDDDDTRRAMGNFCHALMTGVMAQWLIDPESSATGTDLAVAMRAIVAELTAATPGTA
jgi:AcrR family transcriptional regulator